MSISMQSNTHFRLATPTDWPRLAALLTDAQLPLDDAQEHLPDFILAFRDDRLVGSAGLEHYGAHAILRSVAVAASERGAGLGQLLVRQALEQARAQNIRHLVLLTTTAKDFFPRFGFRQITRSEAPEAVTVSVEFHGVCPASATVMQLDL